MSRRNISHDDARRYTAVVALVALTLVSGCSTTSGPAGAAGSTATPVSSASTKSQATASSAPPAPTTSRFGSASAAEVAAYLAGAGVDASAQKRCAAVTSVDASHWTTAVTVSFADALAINLAFTSDPSWPYARGNDNRMTVALRHEDPAARTAVCVNKLSSPLDGYLHDVAVIFSNGTWGEIGMY